MSRKKGLIAQAALDQAQDLIYDAWEADTGARRIALAKQALATSPLCADAYVLLAEHAEIGSEGELELWRRGLEAGEAALGKKDFEEYAGLFWGVLETRPYLRARLGLAQALWRRGIRDEAIDHLRAMLQLNPNDNQGVRYVLAGYLAEAARDRDLALLLAEYEGDYSAAWTWTAALLAFRRNGAIEESDALLAEALASNRHVAPYLLGERRLPRHSPRYINPGQKDEAAYYVKEFSAGWTMTPGAIDWLRARTAAMKAPPRRPRQSRLH